MKGFLDLPYRLPFARHYAAFDRGFYVDFPVQLRLMGRWLRESGCRTALDIGAMTGGCIEYISSLGIRMDGVQFTADVKRLAEARFRKAGVRSTLFVSPIHADLRVPGNRVYDGVVTLGWLNLPFSKAYLRRYLATVRRLLAPGGVFLFDFFEFKDVKVTPPEAVRVSGDLIYVSHGELLGDRLRRHHYWIVEGRRLRAETSDLVDRTAAEARALLEEAGFRIRKRRFLDLNYPRHFWLAERVEKGPDRRRGAPGPGR
jgi:SAM-dependent methyltransferase